MIPSERPRLARIDPRPDYLKRVAARPYGLGEEKDRRAEARRRLMREKKVVTECVESRPVVAPVGGDPARSTTRWGENAASGVESPLRPTVVLEAHQSPQIDLWAKYCDPESDRMWYWNTATGDWFYEDTVGPWQKYSDHCGRLWWWNNDSRECFYEPEATRCILER